MTLLGSVPVSASTTCADYSMRLQLMDSIAVPGGVSDVAVHGQILLAASTAGGLLVYDLARGGTPVLLATLPTTGRSQRLWVDHGLCYLADGPGGLNVIDIQDPASPRLLGSFLGPATVLSVTVSGSHAYLSADTEGLVIVDISDPTDPRMVGQLDTPGNLRQLAVQGTFAFLCDGTRGLHVVDVSDPASPVTVKTVPLLGPSVFDIDFVGSFAYVAAIDIVVLDMTDPGSPVLIARLPAGTGNVTVQDQMALVSTGAGLVVLDIGDPMTPEYLAGTGCASGPAVKRGDVVFVAGLTGIDMVDATNPTSPPLVGSVVTTGRAEQITVARGYGFTVSCTNSVYHLETIDFRDPTRPVLLPGTARLGIPHAIEAQGGYLYVAATTRFNIYDVRDPALPRGVATVPLAACDVVLKGDLAFVAASTEFAVVAVAQPASPRVIARLNTPGVAAGVAVARGYAYVATWDPFGGLFVLDVRNPERPSIIATLETGMYPHRVAVAGGYAYLRGVEKDMAVVDVRDPHRPEFVARVRSGSTTAVDDDLLYLGRGDITVMSVREPDRPEFIGSLLPLGFVVWDLELHGELLYFAGNRGAGVAPVHCRERRTGAGELVPQRAPPLRPRLLSLTLAGPNPFIDVAQLRASAPAGSPASVSVYDVTGRLVRRLRTVAGWQGPRELQWDGRNDEGELVSSGSYFVRLELSEDAVTRRIVKVAR